jgi:hypothetical protein
MCDSTYRFHLSTHQSFTFLLTSLHPTERGGGGEREGGREKGRERERERERERWGGLSLYMGDDVITGKGGRRAKWILGIWWLLLWQQVCRSRLCDVTGFRSPDTNTYTSTQPVT